MTRGREVIAYGAIRRPLRSVKCRMRSDLQPVWSGKSQARSNPKVGAERQGSDVEQSTCGAKALSAEQGAIHAQHEREVSEAEQSADGPER